MEQQQMPNKQLQPLIFLQVGPRKVVGC
jgi:hypothetical protein